MARRGGPGDAPQVSVVIASYRWPDALRLAIESALGQTVEEIEVLVVEDGLDTASREVVRSIGDRRVRWFRRWPRSGSQTGPNQKGRRLARAPVVAYLGHDDIWAPDHLEGLLDALGTGADVAHSTTLMLGIPAGERLAGSKPFTPDHFVPPSSMAHLRDSPRVGRWPRSARVTPQVDWHFFNTCFQRGAKFAVSGRPTTLKYAATQSPDAFRKRDCSRQGELVRRLAADPDLPGRIEAELLEAGVAPILGGGDGERSGPSLTGGWGRRQKGFHGRFGLRSYRWQADAPERFPGWGEPREGTGGRTVRQAAGDGSARVRFDTPRRPWARFHADLEWSGEGGAPALTLDGQPLSTRVERGVDGNPGQIRLTADRRLWRKGRSAVIDVGIAPTADAAVGVSRIWVGRWPEGSDRHSRLWPVRQTAIRLLRSRLTDD